MFKNILLFVLVVLLAWMSKDYFSIKLPNQKPVEYDKPLQKKVDGKILDKKSHTQKTTHVVKSNPMHINKLQQNISIENNVSFHTLLTKDKIYEAIEVYIDASERDKKKYAIQIHDYLERLAQDNVNKALLYMRAYLEEVQDSKVKNLMIETYITQGDLKTAVALILEEKENYKSEVRNIRLSKKLKITAKTYIKELQKNEEYGELVDFLEAMIAFDEQESFYIFTLATLYVDLKKTVEASVLLESLAYDDTYGEKSSHLMKEIEKEEPTEQYKYHIPLKRYGNHYVVEVFLEGKAFNLMLDTGATYIFIDEDKASGLKVINYNLTLRTAGNDIRAKLCQASVLEVGSVKLENIKVTIAPFKRDDIDGLLGMNFFKHFRFFINQDEDILYLDPKH